MRNITIHQNLGGGLTVTSLATQLGLVPIFERAMSYYPDTFGSNLLTSPLGLVPVAYDPRLQRTGGKCYYSPRVRLTLHVALATQQVTYEEHIGVFLHEAAHGMAWMRYGRPAKGHGEYWWEMMHLLAQRPRRCHTVIACRKASLVSRANLEDLDL